VRVECIQTRSSTTGERVKKSPWLTVGKTYTVLAISASPGREILLRLIGDDGDTAGLFSSDMFETIDTRLPPTWIAKLDTDGTLELAPAEWMREGFWEDYFNGDPSAISAFEGARRIIEAA
jgi:hypothetical protein